MIKGFKLEPTLLNLFIAFLEIERLSFEVRRCCRFLCSPPKVKLVSWGLYVVILRVKILNKTKDTSSSSLAIVFLTPVINPLRFSLRSDSAGRYALDSSFAKLRRQSAVLREML